MPLVSKKNTVDAWVGARSSAFSAKQEAWKAARGEYWQGLITHATRPAQDASTAPDRLGSSPTDRPFTWNQFLAFTAPGSPAPIVLPATLPAALIFNVYEAPGGWGWELVATFDYGTPVRRYTKVWNTGPETFRQVDWVETIP